MCVCVSHSVVSNSLWPHGLQPTMLLCPWNSAGRNTGVGCHFLLQGIFPTQGSKPGLPHCRWILYQLRHQGSPLTLSSLSKNLPVMQETGVQSLCQEDPLEKGMEIHFRILSWEIPWTEKSGGLRSMGLQRVTHDWETNTFTLTSPNRPTEHYLNHK